MLSYRLLDKFRETFLGHAYRHRRSNLGDAVAIELYEDLFELGRSHLLVDRIKSGTRVINRTNRRQGIIARRGDGTFGELVPGGAALWESGFQVARGPIATVELGIEVKIVATAMLKQVDRVISDLQKQVEHFRRGAGNPICVGIVGINAARQYISYEGERTYRTDGRGFPHPSQKAGETEERLIREAGARYDEFLVLRFRAPNDPPYPFEWVAPTRTELDYGAILTRISREYDARFR